MGREKGAADGIIQKTLMKVYIYIYITQIIIQHG